MASPLETDAGSELFSGYEAELKLVQADLNQKLDQIAESQGEERKSAIKQAERALEEATELVNYCLHTPKSSNFVTCLLTDPIAPYDKTSLLTHDPAQNM